MIKILAILLVILLVSCNGSENRKEVTFLTKFKVRDKNGVITDRVREGETINFELSITNDTNKEQELLISQPYGYLKLYNSNNEVVWISDTNVYPAVIDKISLNAYEILDRSFSWDQYIGDGSYLQKGNYRAEGLFNNQNGSILVRNLEIY